MTKCLYSKACEGYDVKDFVVPIFAIAKLEKRRRFEANMWKKLTTESTNHSGYPGNAFGDEPQA